MSLPKIYLDTFIYSSISLKKSGISKNIDNYRREIASSLRESELDTQIKGSSIHFATKKSLIKNRFNPLYNCESGIIQVETDHQINLKIKLSRENSLLLLMLVFSAAILSAAAFKLFLFAAALWIYLSLAITTFIFIPTRVQRYLIGLISEGKEKQQFLVSLYKSKRSIVLHIITLLSIFTCAAIILTSKKMGFTSDDSLPNIILLCVFIPSVFISFNGIGFWVGFLKALD